MSSRHAVAALAGGALLLLAPAAAHAQLRDGTVVEILRECRKIAEVSARTACYDNIPLESPDAGTPPPRSAPAVSGFGSRQLPPVRSPRAGSREPERLTAAVTAAVERQPGVYLLTLADGAQWQFVDAMPSSYDPPRRGSEVEIAAAALGSYLMTYAGQRAVRVHRVR